MIMKKVIAILMLGCIGYIGVAAQNTQTNKSTRQQKKVERKMTRQNDPLDTATKYKRQGDTLIDTKAKNSTNNMNDQYKP